MVPFASGPQFYPLRRRAMEIGYKFFRIAMVLGLAPKI